MTERDVRVLDGAEDVARAVADEILGVLPRDPAGRSVAIVLAGGRTPLRAYELVAAAAAADAAIAWARVHFAFGDERCVPPDDPASNFGAARRALLDRVPVPAANVHRIRGEDAPGAAAIRYEVELRLVHAAFGFRLVLLGMGADGHTASLFPGGPELDESRRWVVPTRSPAAPHDRVTVTFPALAAGQRVVFAVTGAEKRAALARVLVGDASLPAARVACPGGVTVLADREAAP